MNPAIIMQIITHAFLWIFILSYEMVGTAFIGFVPNNHWVYVVALAQACVGLLLLCRFGDGALLRDMRELFLYDLMVQLLGVVLSYFQRDMFIYQALIGSVTILKFVRLLWLNRKVDFGADAGWPVFGLIGFLEMRRRRRDHDGYGSVVSSGQKKMTYSGFLVAIFLSAFLVEIGFGLSYLLAGAIPVFLISLYYKRFINYLMQAELSRIEAEKQLAIANATAAINAELSAKNTQLQEANRQRDVMLADLTIRNECLRDASHDLAAPAFWITSCAQQLACAPDEPTRKMLAAQLLDSVGHYNQLLQATIHGAKLITHIEKPTLHPISVNKLCTHLWDKYLAIFEEKGLRFGIYKANQYIVNADGNVCPDINPERRALAFHIASDEHILMRILNNLIMNALRNTAQGRVRVAFRKRPDGMCWIEVRDTGKGFEGVDGPDWVANFDEVARRIKAGKMKASEVASHGLGINNIRNLCAAIDSRMMLYSCPGQGSIFRLAVPLAQPLDADNEVEAQTWYFG